ncbi:hypothetical protein FSP39_008058 [Pinctada imbricata]|uniref:Poly [ADP-ribose] polymerase n=1 Tax=Pinctada imbricata TaxID=66713 RepID=A0AA88Y7Q5_PINIB|nr:hypothetical protein FSP39_008058 [Pinctada imbricata]
MTWERETKFFFGLGRRAKKLRLTKIQRIENLQLYKEYAQERQKFFDKALKNDVPFHTVGQTRYSSGEVKTQEILFGNPLLSDTVPEINEHYLFHGTSHKNIESVLSQGLDNRLAGPLAKFGAGVYAAESSTKADEYTDDSDVGLKMLLVRICLGDVFVCNRRTNFSRAPCKSCSKDRCTCNHGFYDSVMADGESRFR